jgi:chromosome segregation ATPase
MNTHHYHDGRDIAAVEDMRSAQVEALRRTVKSQAEELIRLRLEKAALQLDIAALREEVADLQRALDQSNDIIETLNAGVVESFGGTR